MKVIPISTLHRIEKLMGLTTSANDHEALSAVRMVNKVLVENKITWGELLRKVVSTSSSPLPYSASDSNDVFEGDAFSAMKPEAMTVPEALAFMQRVKPNKFIDSLATFYADRGFLTKAQKDRLFENVREHARSA